MALKVNVGLSRKLSRDYNSTGYSVNLEGEVAIPLDDPEAVIEKIREYYDLADEALRDQIERYESDSAIASRDEERPVTSTQPQSIASNGNGHQPPPVNGGHNRSGHRTEEAATNKQVQFLLTMGKRHKLTGKALENRIAQIVGRTCGVYDLTKREAGLVLDELTSGNGHGR
ncbi:MAG: hypothetical protein KatS3mg105_4932 [Gemmatales bacterium]|nr:MAG: hypothetical protein KatS3mg105_4932 [Gemmatales bacterium]